jgi:hypothetical protein
MFFWTKKTNPFRKGTGQFIINVHWYFWDDPDTPGLITGDGLSQAAKEAFTAAENSRFSIMLVSDRLYSSKPPSREKLADSQLLFAKLGKYLKDVREKEPTRFHDYVIPYWSRENSDTSMIDVFKAYINVLDSWGHGYTWQPIKTAKDVDGGVLLMFQNEPTHYITQADVDKIIGLPNDFDIWMSGVISGQDRIPGKVWQFNCDSKGFGRTDFANRRR